MTLTTSERRELVAILELLSGHLESAIQSSIVPGTGTFLTGYPGADWRSVNADRRTWRRVDAWKADLAAEVDLGQQIDALNELHTIIQQRKADNPATRIAYRNCVGGVLNAYREGDLTFEDAAAVLCICERRPRI